ncbi:SgrR family transcriptional regulator [Pseudalkalibacillus sp. SCS-8]|uniref:SgrR family transcriptional regulator n=1 Tax=Pseudalkalibacillus nanhaiensis TaxID=3115291 RepID=UPI0032DBB14A
MKLEELYIRIRTHFSEQPNEKPIDIQLQDLADISFYTMRSLRLVIKKMETLGWITWKPGKGRGNTSSITFHKNVEDIQLELFKSMILQGKENEAFIRVDTEAPSIKMALSDWYYQSKFLVHYDQEKNRIHIRLRELITKENVEIYKSMIIENLSKTRPGFTILMDMTDEQVNTPDVESDMQELRKLIAEKDLKAIATYTSSPYLKTYMESRLEEMGPHQTFASRDKAEAYLNEIAN